MRKISVLINQYGISVQELSEFTDISERQIVDAMTGTDYPRHPSKKTLKTLAEFFEFEDDPKALMDDVPVRTKQPHRPRTISREEFEELSNKNKRNVAFEYMHGNKYRLKHLSFGGPCEYIVEWYKPKQDIPDRYYLGTFSTEDDAIKAFHEFQLSHMQHKERKIKLKADQKDINETIAETLANSLATYYEDYNIRYCENDDWKNDDLIHAMILALVDADATCEYPLGLVQRLAASLKHHEVLVDEALLQALARDFAEFIIDGDSNE